MKLVLQDDLKVILTPEGDTAIIFEWDKSTDGLQ